MLRQNVCWLTNQCPAQAVHPLLSSEAVEWVVEGQEERDNEGPVEGGGAEGVVDSQTW